MEFQHPVRARRGPVPMAEYRLYFLDSVERLISGSFEFEAASDEAAVRIAEAWREGRPLELWRGARKLKSWDGGAG